jgi:hypothetical protein
VTLPLRQNHVCSIPQSVGFINVSSVFANAKKVEIFLLVVSSFSLQHVDCIQTVNKREPHTEKVNAINKNDLVTPLFLYKTQNKNMGKYELFIFLYLGFMGSSHFFSDFQLLDLSITNET